MRALGWLFAVLGFMAVSAWFLGFLVLSYVVDWDVPAWFHGIGGVGALLMGAWLFLDWGSLSDLGRDQTVSRSFNAGLLLLVGLGIGVAANVVGNRYDKKWDFTENKKFTLADESLSTAKNLDKEVEVVAFFPGGSAEENNFRELIEGYTDESTLIKVSWHDPYSDPVGASREGITSPYGTVIVRAGGVEERITSGFGEEELTNALVKVTAGTTHSLCAVTGHGEFDIQDEASPDRGAGLVFGKLLKQNYTIKALNVLQEQPTPEACEALVLAGPRQDLLPSELDRLAEYVTAGGRLVVFLDPTMAPATAADMSRYGVVVGNDIVLDPVRQLMDMGQTSVGLMGDSFATHPITDKLTGLVGLPATRSVASGPAIPGLTVTELMHTGSDGWAEQNSLLDGSAAQPDATEKQGEVSLAVAVEVTDPSAVPVHREAASVVPTADGVPALTPVVSEPPPQLTDKEGGRVVVFGSALFASNALATYGLNSDLALNAVGWSRGDDKAITIRTKEGAKGKITVTVLDGLIAALVSIFVVPGIAVAGAVGTWMLRRQN